MSKLTRLCCSVWGMVFMVTALLFGVWFEVDPLELLQRALFSGLAGIACGYVVGRFFTGYFKDWLGHNSKVSDSQEKPFPEEKEEREPKLQPWNPPKISKEDQGR